MKLYEINISLRNLWDRIEAQEGELTEEDLRQLETLNLETEEKIKGYGLIIRELDAEVDEIDNEIKRLTALKKSRKNKREWLSNSLKNFMLDNNIPKFDSVQVNVRFIKSHPLEIAEGTELPEQFVRISYEPDKKAITDYIKQGGSIEGCQIIEKNNIQIK